MQMQTQHYMTSLHAKKEGNGRIFVVVAVDFFDFSLFVREISKICA